MGARPKGLLEYAPEKLFKRAPGKDLFKQAPD